MRLGSAKLHRLAPVALLVAIAASAQLASNRFDPVGAEQALSRAVAQLEEIAGPDLLAEDPPPLPRVEPPALAAEEWGRVSALLDEGRTAWPPEDEAFLESIFARSAAALVALAKKPRNAAEPDAVLEGGLSLLRLLRLQALRDRRALSRDDEGAFLEGVALRSEIAARLLRQPSIAGAWLAVAQQRQVLEDVQLAVRREATSELMLEAMDSLLDGWIRLPDAAALIAREGLWVVQQSDRLAARVPRELAATPSSGVDAPLLVPVVEAFVGLAQACRSSACAPAIAALQQQVAENAEPRDVLVGLLLPNTFYLLGSVEGLGELVELARTAIALRLVAIQESAYPERLDALPATLATARGELLGLAYERGERGARLVLDRADAVAASVGRSQRSLERLLAWDLPLAGHFSPHR